jgi:hypothetical protein
MNDRKRGRFERRAGIRFGYLVKQLIDDGWKASAIAAAIGADKGLVATWLRKATNPTAHHNDSRIGITDQTIQGVVDGLGIRSDLLFMPTNGYPNTVKLKDGGERPCAPDELDHKLFKVIDLKEAREKRDVVALQKHAVATDATLDDIKRDLRELTVLVKAALLNGDQRNSR